MENAIRIMKEDHVKKTNSSGSIRQKNMVQLVLFGERHQIVTVIELLVNKKFSIVTIALNVLISKARSSAVE